VSGDDGGSAARSGVGCLHCGRPTWCALEIIGAPPWANGGKPWNWAPTNPKDYADFAIAASKRYPSVHLWMIWGEPSRGHDFEPLDPAKPFAKLNVHQRSAPHRYARILDAAYGALKSVSHSNLVIGGMTGAAGDISPQLPGWKNALLACPPRRTVDVAVKLAQQRIDAFVQCPPVRGRIGMSQVLAHIHRLLKVVR
jgi:hypothetical protein